MINYVLQINPFLSIKNVSVQYNTRMFNNYIVVLYYDIERLFLKMLTRLDKTLVNVKTSSLQAHYVRNYD